MCGNQSQLDEETNNSITRYFLFCGFVMHIWENILKDVKIFVWALKKKNIAKICVWMRHQNGISVQETGTEIHFKSVSGDQQA